MLPFRGVGAFMVLVAAQLSVLGSYLPPVLTEPPALPPPQTIISLPVQIAVWRARALGGLVVLVAVHVFSVHAAPPDIVESV